MAPTLAAAAAAANVEGSPVLASVVDSRVVTGEVAVVCEDVVFDGDVVLDGDAGLLACLHCAYNVPSNDAIMDCSSV